MTGIDIVDSLWFTLNVSSVTDLLGNGKVWKHNRPRNSPYTDVVISVPEYNASEFNTGYVDINVHTPNLREMYPIPDEGEDTTFPDLAKLRSVVDAILPLLTSSGGYSLDVRIPGIPIRDNSGEWYANIRVGFEAINPDETVVVALQKETSAPDGYGGVTLVFSDVWSGNAARQNIKEGNQMEIGAGKYELHLQCDWLVPAEAAPQKYMQLQAPDGQYVIRGIAPENDYWRLFTVRKDGDY